MNAPAPPPADGPKSLSYATESAHRPRSLDHAMAEAAVRQHGLITLDQLRALGLTEAGARSRVAAGRLHRVQQGVYAVGHLTRTRNSRFMAAVLACGPGAVLSHLSAGALWGIRRDPCDAVDVTARNRRGRVPLGINAHRDGSLALADRTTLQGIPCTSMARTLLDLAGIVSVRELEKAVSEAEILRLLDHRSMRALIKRGRGRRGVARLRMVLDAIHPEAKRTRSEMELRFLRMCEQAGLPRPEVNVSLNIGGTSVMPDFLWRDAGLIVEADGRRYHDTDAAFQRDRRRDQRLQLAGWRVIRCTWEQIHRESRELARTIGGLLTQPSSRRRA